MLKYCINRVLITLFEIFNMTLHEAMKEAIKLSGNFLTAEEIANIINDKQLYTRADGKPIPPSQVRARARKYIGMFRVSNGIIGL